MEVLVTRKGQITLPVALRRKYGIKEGMKRAQIATFMEVTLRQQDKLRENFIEKIKRSPYFELE